MGRNLPDDAALSVSTATVSVLQRGRHTLTVYSYNVSEATPELSDPEHITDVHASHVCRWPTNTARKVNIFKY